MHWNAMESIPMGVCKNMGTRAWGCNLWVLLELNWQTTPRGIARKAAVCTAVRAAERRL